MVVASTSTPPASAAAGASTSQPNISASPASSSASSPRAYHLNLNEPSSADCAAMSLFMSDRVLDRGRITCGVPGTFVLVWSFSSSDGIYPCMIVPSCAPKRIATVLYSVFVRSCVSFLEGQLAFSHAA